jgi:hypothetical protein
LRTTVERVEERPSRKTGDIGEGDPYDQGAPEKQALRGEGVANRPIGQSVDPGYATI